MAANNGKVEVVQGGPECPLCGRENHCGMVAGKKSCWCFTTEVDPDTLTAMRPEHQGETCVCERCATGRQDL